MPRRRWRFRVQDMVDAIDAIEEYTEDLSEESFAGDRLVVDAVLRNLTVIGEAAARLPEAVTRRLPSIPWPDVVGMRNVVVHEYFGVSLPIIWQTIRQDLPRLGEELRRVLEEPSDDGLDKPRPEG